MKADETPQYLVGLNLNASKGWPYFGIFIGFVVSNMILVLAFMKLYTWRNFSDRRG